MSKAVSEWALDYFVMLSSEVTIGCKKKKLTRMFWILIYSNRTHGIVYVVTVLLGIVNSNSCFIWKLQWNFRFNVFLTITVSFFVCLNWYRYCICMCLKLCKCSLITAKQTSNWLNRMRLLILPGELWYTIITHTGNYTILHLLTNVFIMWFRNFTAKSRNSMVIGNKNPMVLTALWPL